MKITRLLVATMLLIATLNIYAQPSKRGSTPEVKGVAVKYQTSNNGRVSPRTIMLEASGKLALIASPNGITSTILDYGTGTEYNTFSGAEENIYTQNNFIVGEGFTVEEQGQETIAGWDCIKYRISVRSNTIELWATTAVGFSGTPVAGYGMPEGLVLKIVRNGSNVIEAVDVQRLVVEPEIMPKEMGRKVPRAEFDYLVRNKDVVSVNIFEDEYIGFNGAKGPECFDAEDFDTVYTLAGGTVLLRRVQLPADASGKVIMVELTQRAEKDAYDRTGSVFVIPETENSKSFLDGLSSAQGAGLASLPSMATTQNDSTLYPGIVATEGYTPPLELMRFFTTFGVGGYNNIEVFEQVWADSVVFKQDVSRLAPELSGNVWVGVYIGNWTDKGHKVSLDIKYHPGYGKSEKEEVILPLFNTVNLLEQAGQQYPLFFDKRPLSVRFYVEKPIENAVLAYTSTGHGGWGGGDEFNPKVNTITLDGEVLMKYTPWREDCASYRQWNPSSGNFANGLSSSDLSRSAWCPGTVTFPTYVQVGALSAGWHTMEVAIPQGAPEGRSISYWCISGTIIGNIAE